MLDAGPEPLPFAAEEIVGHLVIGNLGGEPVKRFSCAQQPSSPRRSLGGAALTSLLPRVFGCRRLVRFNLRCSLDCPRCR